MHITQVPSCHPKEASTQVTALQNAFFFGELNS